MKVPAFVTDPNPDLYKTGKYVVLDFETTNKEKGTALNEGNQIVLACWLEGQAGKLTSKRHTFGSEYEMGEMLDAIAKADFIVAQNAKFELQWLERCGYEVGSHPVYDTYLAEWVIGGNRWVHSALGMDEIAKRRKFKQKSKIIKLLMKAGICPSNMPKSILKKYCFDDVFVTHDIMQDQLKDMEGTRLLPIVYSRCLVAIALADIEKSGAFLDKKAVKDEYEKTVAEFAEVSKQLDALTEGMNMNSTPQKIEFIYEKLGFAELTSTYNGKPIRTPAGNPKTDKNTILQLKVETEEQQKFIDLKLKQGKLGSALSKTLDFFAGVCDEKDGLFYGEIKQGTTRTHRLSSAGRSIKFEAYPKPKSCQFQNFPNQYKPLMGSRHEDWLLCEADGAQLEFRIGGHLGRDSQIIYDVVHKTDIHTCTADALVEAGDPELCSAPVKSRRRLAKKSTFRPMYGGTRGSPAIEAYCKFFADKYNELHTTQTGWAFEAADKGYIETEWGMKYYFPDVKVQQSGYIKGQQQVFNYPIQAFATAEVIPLALVYFWYYTRDAELIITNTVHDSFICEVPPWELDLFQKYAVKSLTTDVYNIIKKLYGIDITVPLGVGMKFGSHWGVSAYKDDELENMVGVLKDMGHKPIIDDGEIVVDVTNEV